jgi:hypothetical protein
MPGNSPAVGHAYELLSIESLDAEPLIRLEDVPKLKIFSGGRRAGGRLSPRTVFRWARDGVRGVKLPVLRVGAVLSTNQTAVIHFLERSTNPTAPPQRPAAQARRQMREAEALLDTVGI